MDKKRRATATKLLWLAAIAWIAVLFFFSGQTGVDSGRLSLMVTRLLMRIFPWLPWPLDVFHTIVRKAAHFCIFAVEGALLAGALMATLRRRGAPGAALAGALCVGMAALNEYHQSFQAGRSCELRDVLIDSCGALTGIALAALIRHICRRRARRRNVII